MSILKFLLPFIIIFSVLPAQRKLTFGWHEEQIKVDNLTRHFTVFIPRACPENASVLFILHSGNSGMETIFN